MCNDGEVFLEDGINQYQELSYSFAIYPNIGSNPEYATLGLTAEAGEIANKVKKLQRDGLSVHSLRDSIASELGDVLWYAARVADEFGLDLGRVAADNLNKLHDRRKRGVIGGSGDDR